MKNLSKVIALLLAICSTTVFLSACADDGYKLTVQDPEHLIIEKLKDRYAADEKITVKTGMLHDAVITVYLDGVALENGTPVEDNGEYTHWEYYFVMPAHNAVLSLETSDGFLS